MKPVVDFSVKLQQENAQKRAVAMPVAQPGNPAPENVVSVENDFNWGWVKIAGRRISLLPSLLFPGLKTVITERISQPTGPIETKHKQVASSRVLRNRTTRPCRLLVTTLSPGKPRGRLVFGWAHCLKFARHHSRRSK